MRTAVRRRVFQNASETHRTPSAVLQYTFERSGKTATPTIRRDTPTRGVRVTRLVLLEPKQLNGVQTAWGKKHSGNSFGWRSTGSSAKSSSCSLHCCQQGQLASRLIESLGMTAPTKTLAVSGSLWG